MHAARRKAFVTATTPQRDSRTSTHDATAASGTAPSRLPLGLAAFLYAGGVIPIAIGTAVLTRWTMLGTEWPMRLVAEPAPTPPTTRSKGESR